MRVRHLITRCGSIVAASAMLLLLGSGPALGQLEITPAPSITPSKTVTTWIFQIAVAALILAVLVAVGFALSYMRFAPRFSGRETKAQPVPPGTRPRELVQQAASMRWTAPAPAAPAPASAPAPAARASATAVAERPAPAPAAPAPAEPTPRPTEGEAAAAEATVRPTAGPSGEPAVQADAVGEAEAAAPEPRPSAKTPDEVGAEPAPTAAPAAATQPAASHGAGLDQETFDRVLQEQLAKGVDRRVAEGRARAAAVVAARKKAQG